MKTVPLAATLLALCAGPALAQSSVTLSGIADAAARSVSNEGRGSIKSLVSGSNSTSRLVIRGAEDLGGGLSASFHLEHGIALDTGNPTGGFWDRRSTVSLASKALGELRLGRDFVPSYSSWSRYDPFGYVGVGGSNNLVSATPNGPIRATFGTAANTTVRSSNAVQVFLPGGLGGLEGAFMAAAGEGSSAANSLNKVLGARIGWAGAGVSLSAGYATTENDLTTAGKFSDTTAGASYNFGFLRLNGVWRQFKQNNAKQTNILVGALVPVGAGEIKASYVQANLAGRVSSSVIDANDATQVAIGYVYNLSKRTALYTTYSRLNNDGAATFVVPGGPTGIAGGKASTGYEAGVRHNF